MDMRDTIKEAAMNMRDAGLAVTVDTLRNIVRIGDSFNGTRVVLEGLYFKAFIEAACVLTQRYPDVSVGDVYAYVAEHHI